MGFAENRLPPHNRTPGLARGFPPCRAQRDAAGSPLGAGGGPGAEEKVGVGDL